MSQYQPPGSGRGSGDDDDFGGYEPRDRGADGGFSGGDRGFTYTGEDRYWTDYLRIAAPVLGVILILGLAWFWINALLGGGNEDATPTPNGQAGVEIITGTTPTPEGAAATPEPVQTPAPGNAATPRPTEFGVGAAVVVANTGDQGVNLRASPTTEGEIVATLPDGTELTITGEAVEADGYTWWPVESADQEGYVVENFLQLAE